jgi:hypothetical protein
MGIVYRNGESALSKIERDEKLSLKYPYPRNEFEQALNGKTNQTINGYRIELLKGGFVSARAPKNKKGKLILVVKMAVKNDS